MSSFKFLKNGEHVHLKFLSVGYVKEVCKNAFFANSNTQSFFHDPLLLM
jgi:hypothetical protein